jgi:tetratricopeptide (TPR) repeat protein/transglutaminase-like putative cysteine protease
VNAPSLPRLRPWLVAAAVIGSTSLSAAPSASAVAPIHEQVVEATQAIAGARGPLQYAELRELWSLWDDTDPIHVEQALRGLQSSPRLAPPMRAYAGLLSAYARRRRGDLQGARSEIARLGYVDQWLVVGPFDNEGRSGLGRFFGPETSLANPLDLQQSHEGKERPVRWRSVPDIFSYAWLDLGDLMRPQEKICAYASTFVRSKQERARTASVWMGTTGAFRLFWNGEQVLSDELYRHLDADRFATSVQVKRGWNRLTVKVCGDAVAPMLTLRLADQRGAPDPTLEASADPAHADAAAKNAVKAGTDPAKAPHVVLRAEGDRVSVRAAGAPPVRERDPGRVRGPIDQFERMMSGARSKPDVLEAYAKYLLRTGGDDPAKLLARDYATRAAEQAPTVDRLLLAATLTQDRNQRRALIDKAAELAGDDPNIDVLLAQAQLTRTGPNWRDAVPLYDRALQLEPDRIEALLGRVDLYNEAGLRRTALGMLQRAVERSPRAVGLLRVYALQLASLGRQSEAEEIGARYAAYRFDDPTNHVARIELAVARRQNDLAQHWINRLLAADPDSSFHLNVAARAYLAMGKPDKAIETYQQALAMAPEDTDAMRALADLFGRLGQRSQQLRLLRQILVLRPQFKDVREYVEHIEPKQPRADEAYAWAAEQFLPLRTTPADGFNKRTLRDLQVTTVYPSGLSSTFHQIVFQPLTDEAAASAREYAFSYQADRQVVQLRAGRVYRADGRIDEAIESNEGPADNPSIAMYTSARMFYVQFPRLDVGDVVELRYRIEEVTPDNVFADYFGEVRYMQSSEPTRNVEYVVIAPTTRKLEFGVSPLPGLQREEKVEGDTNIYRFFAPSVAAILPEPNMPPWSEVLGHVHVSTYKTWKDVGSWYWGLAREQLNPDDELRRKVMELTKGLKTDEEKVRAIYGYVVKRTRYVALEFGIYGFKPRRASQTFARGWGDCKDKATLIVSMLGIAGIPANLVVVRTALRGSFPKDPASLAPFDHAIAYVPSLDLYLDGTAEYTGSTEFPAFDRGSMALVVRPNNSSLVTMPDPPASETVRGKKLRASLRADGSAQVTMQYETSGAIAAQWRLRYHGENTRRDRVGADMAQNLPGFVLAPGKAGFDANDLEDIEQSVRFHARGSTPTFARRQGKELSVPVTPQDRFVPRFASLSQRKLDTVLRYRSTIDETWTIDLPPGSKVQELPKAYKVSTPYGSLALEVTQGTNSVEVHTVVTFGKKRITPAEYAAFVKFCEEVDRALNQRLVVGG